MSAQEHKTVRERRPLSAGLKPSVDRTIESAFVHADKPKPAATPNAPASASVDEGREGKVQATGHITRAPLTIRFRADFAAALKRASLQRQLDGQTPNTLQDILEEAVEPWLRANGYLS